ncbi:MAG: ABC transporter permease subunit [Pirellulaceae bacterium]|nr:ABC transporter permease subunit [Pirellulaceae bacterium]
MRAYVAIIRDSFQEALSSRVLWILLVVITLLLLLILPSGYKESVTVGLRQHDVKRGRWPEFASKIQQESEADAVSPSRHLVALANEDLKAFLKKTAVQEKKAEVGKDMKFWREFDKFLGGLNELLEKPEFYRADVWENVIVRSDEARELLELDANSLSAEQVQRRNRLLLEAAYPEMLQVSPQTAMSLTYFGKESDRLPFRKAQFDAQVTHWGELVIRWIAGTIGIFVAIIVTAGMIPQMFDAGSWSLLLSKPVSRSVVFLAKFIGGSAFMLLNAAYFICGVWFILGFRFGIWDGKLLLMLPLYVFVFVIYYAVSALAGVIWRSPIVCVIISIVFWAACFVVGAIHSGVERFVYKNSRLTSLMFSQDTLMGVSEVGVVSHWDEDAQEWKQVFRSSTQEQLQAMLMFAPAEAQRFLPIGYVLDKQGEQLLTVQRNFPGLRSTLRVGRKADNWSNQEGAGAPMYAKFLLREPDGTPLIVSSAGLDRLEGDPLAKSKPVKVLGVSLPLTGSRPLRSVQPGEPVVLTDPAAAAINEDTGQLALYSRGTLTVLEPDEKHNYQKQREIQLDLEDADQAVALAFGGTTVLLAFEDGHVSVYDLKTAKEENSFNPDRGNPPRFIQAAPGGKWFAVVFHTGRMWLYDAAANEGAMASFASQGAISTMTFSGNETMLVAERGTRVKEYNLDTRAVQKQFAAEKGIGEMIYDYAVTPIYTVFPKPGELDRTAQYFLTGKETESFENMSLGSLTVARDKLDPWTPVWSSLIFMLVVLGIACLYIERQEF